MSPVHVMTFASVLWGIHGVPVALSAASSGYVSLSRFLLSSLFLFPFLLICSRKKSSFAQSCSGASLLSALFWALTGILFVCAIAIEGGSVVSTVALSYCFPVFTIGIGYLKTGVLSRKDSTCTALVLYGVYCFLPEFESAAFYSSILALLSGLSLALHLECAERAKSAGSIIWSILIGHIAGIFMSCMFLIEPQELLVEVATLSINQHLWILILGLLTGVTYLMYALAAPALAGTTTSMLLLLELVIATIAGYYLLSETVDFFKILGIIAMLSALSYRLYEPQPIVQVISRN